ncbi:MAG: ArnT family glycosyltransferase [Ignavibacteria bacterium]
MSEKKTLALILIYFIAFAITLTFIVPPFESPDEDLHLDYINYLSKYGKLPNQYEDYKNPAMYVGQGHQPPLYYILMSSINYIINNGKEVKLIINHNKKHSLFGGTEGKVPNFDYYNVNAFPDVGTKRMFYLFRIISILFGVVTLLYVYKTIKLVFEDKRIILLSLFVAASTPQFVFMNAVINNDSLAIMFMSMVVYYFFRIITNPTGLKDYLIAGILIGISVITKKTLLFAVPGVIILSLYFMYKNKTERVIILKNVSVLLLIAIIVSAAYFIRNQMFYGDLLGSQMELDTMPQHIEHKSLFSSFFIFKFFPTIYHSYIGSFGWMNVKLPLLIYGLVSLVFISSVAGYAAHIRTTAFSNTYVNYGFILIVLAIGVLAYANLSFTQAQGRYMLPLISVISINIVYGLNLLTDKFKAKTHLNKVYTGTAAIMILSALASIYTIYKFYFTADVYN